MLLGDDCGVENVLTRQLSSKLSRVVGVPMCTSPMAIRLREDSDPLLPAGFFRSSAHVSTVRSRAKVRARSRLGCCVASWTAIGAAD
jgi:hypothetical protein